eukprot:3592840-Alexandrium_andersonii.AAC.1
MCIRDSSMATVFVLMTPQLPVGGSSQQDGRGQTCDPSSMTCAYRASCIVSGLAPLQKAIADEFGISDGFMGTAS